MRGPATVTRPSYDLMMLVRQLSTVHAGAFDYTTVDRMLARVGFVLELSHLDVIGPLVEHAEVVILEAEYKEFLEIACLARLHELPRGAMDRRLYLQTMRGLCGAVGRDAANEWQLSVWDS